MTIDMLAATTAGPATPVIVWYALGVTVLIVVILAFLRHGGPGATMRDLERAARKAKKNRK